MIAIPEECPIFPSLSALATEIEKDTGSDKSRNLSDKEAVRNTHTGKKMVTFAMMNQRRDKLDVDIRRFKVDPEEWEFKNHNGTAP